MKIKYYPSAFRGSSNPLHVKQAAEIAKLGWEIIDYNNIKSKEKFEFADILHFHWIENVTHPLKKRSLFARIFEFRSRLRQLRAIFFHIDLLKSRGGKVVWTAHNVFPHSGRNTVLSWIFWRKFYPALDGVVFLSETSRVQFYSSHEKLKTTPSAVIRRGNFDFLAHDVPTRQEARKALGIAENEFVVLGFGKIKKYKNYVKLVSEFRKANLPKSRLIIAGSQANELDESERVRKAADNDERVRLHFDFLEHRDLIKFIAASDVVCNPYLNVLNSATLLLALACKKPFIGPALGTIQELSEQLGNDWVMAFEGDFSKHHLAEAFRLFGPSRGPCAPPDMSAFDWTIVARQTEDFYRELIQ